MLPVGAVLCALASGSGNDAWQPVRDALDGFGMIPGLTFLVGNASGTVFTHNKGGVTPDSVQNIFSATKWVAGVAIMKEVQEGRIDLNAPINQYLTYWSKDARDARSQTTLRHLLGFASGYTDVTQSEGYMLPLKCAWSSIQECAEASYEDFKINEAPGSIIDYNSLHLTFAGAVAEQATGKPILEIIKKNVLEPAGMEGTYFRDHSDRNPFLAGGLMAPSKDYMRFLHGVFTNSLVSAETNALMMSDGYPDAEKKGLFSVLPFRYGLANWFECPQVLSRWGRECLTADIHTSPGASGSYPLIDRSKEYYYYLGYDGTAGVGAVISMAFRDTLKPLVDAAMAGQVTDLPTKVPEERQKCLFKVMEKAMTGARVHDQVC